MTKTDSIQLDADADPQSSNSLGYLALLIVFDSLHFVFARWLSSMLPPLTASFWMMTSAALILWVYTTACGKVQYRILKQNLVFFLIVGGLVGSTTWLNYTALTHIDAGTAGLLSRITTVFSILLGVFWLGDRMTGRQWLGAVVAVAGAVTIQFQAVDSIQWGALIVIVSSFGYALHAAVVKRFGADLDFANFFLFRVLASSFALGVFLVFSEQPFQMRAINSHSVAFMIMAVTAAGVMDVILSRIFYYVVLLRIPISLHAIILMLSPVATIIWSLVFFGEAPSLQGIVGGAIVIAGIAIVSNRRQPG